MAEFTIFFAGIFMALTISFSVIWYLRRHLKNILVDICGTKPRANFWIAFSNIALVITPLIFATAIMPENNCATDGVIRLIAQIRWALIGLMFTVLALGATIQKKI